MKAFIICLSQIESSMCSAKNMIAPLKSFGFDVKFFEGTYGNEAVQLAKTENRVIHPFRPVGKVTNTTPGILGCFYSHYRLWKTCVDLNEPIFIFEDDCIFVRKYHPVQFDEVLILIQGSWLKMCNVDIYKDPTIEPTSLDYTSNCMPGAVGYGITPIAAKKLLNEYNNTYLPADVAINNNVVKIQLHSHIMGRALVKKDGKMSLTESNWN